MRTIALAICVLLAGCGNKKRTPDVAVDRYINQDLAPHLAKIMAARAGYDDINASYIESAENLPNLTHRLTDAAYPFLTQALDGLGKITPPASVKLLHEDLIAIVKEEQAAIGEMSKALDPVDEATFKAGHAKMMAVQEAIFSWDKKLEVALVDHAVKMKELPDVEIPKPRGLPPTSAAAAKPEPPAMCKSDTVSVSETGEPKSCTTEMMFAHPDTDPATPKAQMVLCGPGELVLDPKGAIVGCTIASDVMVDGTKVPKGSKVRLAAKAKVVSAELPDGKVFTAAP